MFEILGFYITVTINPNYTHYLNLPNWVIIIHLEGLVKCQEGSRRPTWTNQEEYRGSIPSSNQIQGLQIHWVETTPIGRLRLNRRSADDDLEGSIEAYIYHPPQSQLGVESLYKKFVFNLVSLSFFFCLQSLHKNPLVIQLFD